MTTAWTFLGDAPAVALTDCGCYHGMMPAGPGEDDMVVCPDCHGLSYLLDASADEALILARAAITAAQGFGHDLTAAAREVDDALADEAAAAAERQTDP